MTRNKKPTYFIAVSDERRWALCYESRQIFSLCKNGSNFCLRRLRREFVHNCEGACYRKVINSFAAGGRECNYCSPKFGLLCGSACILSVVTALKNSRYKLSLNHTLAYISSIRITPAPPVMTAFGSLHISHFHLQIIRTNLISL